jgi:transitional endoplasmic reticulum ATPase
LVAFRLSPWLSWFTIGTGAVLLTWHTKIQGTYRGLLYFLTLIPVLHWFNLTNEFLFHEDVVSGMVTSRDGAQPLESAYGLIFALAAIAGLILVIRHRPKTPPAQAALGSNRKANVQPCWSNIPTRTFTDVGGMEPEKRRIAAVVDNRLYPERYRQHGVEQNGILLYGPRGTGKTFLAEAVAGEFRMNYWYVRPTALMQSLIGSSEASIRSAFAQAYAHRPVLFFLDEIDAIGAQRQELSKASDPTGSGKLYNAVVTELMQCIDQYRKAQGFVIMAATNFYEGLDEALIRDLRFDEKIRVDLPDEAARVKILTAQLARRLWTPFAVDRLASRTPGWSAAKLASLVNKAASVAAFEHRPIAERDLEQALGDTGGNDRPLIRAVDWVDLVLSPSLEQDLRSLIRLMDPHEAERLKVPVPTGLLLVGPSGTGKTSIAHLIATQTRRSFYAITPADVPTPEKLAQVFARAREQSPSIILIDEIDGLLPRGDNGYYMGQHQLQFVDQALMLMSELEPANQVFLVGTTNHPDGIDPRVLRGGRFSDKLVIGIPDDEGYLRFLRKCLGPIPLDPDLTADEVVSRLRGIAPADLDAVVGTAKRMAMNRMKPTDQSLPPLVWNDFEQALARNHTSS